MTKAQRAWLDFKINGEIYLNERLQTIRKMSFLAGYRAAMRDKKNLRKRKEKSK